MIKYAIKKNRKTIHNAFYELTTTIVTYVYLLLTFLDMGLSS